MSTFWIWLSCVMAMYISFEMNSFGADFPTRSQTWSKAFETHEKRMMSAMTMAPVGSRYYTGLPVSQLYIPAGSKRTEGSDKNPKKRRRPNFRCQRCWERTYPNKSIAHNRHDKAEDVDEDVITVVHLAGSVRKSWLVVLTRRPQGSRRPTKKTWTVGYRRYVKQ